MNEKMLGRKRSKLKSSNNYFIVIFISAEIQQIP